MRRRTLLAAVTLAALATAPVLQAAGPQFWRLEGTDSFLKGELSNLSLDSDGRLRLGPATRTLFDPELPNGWSVARDESGVVFVGTGNDGRVFRVEGDSGKVVFDAEELEVYAVVVAPGGDVYAATSPDGAVHALDLEGGSRVVFDPAETYVWALEVDASGHLIVATGAEGRVYRVNVADGTSETLLDSAETHILSLDLDAEGRVLAGSAPEGIVYRIGASGDVFVLIDSPYREIKALAAAPDGGVYAAAVNGGTDPSPVPPPPPPAAAGAATAPVAQVTVTESFAMAAPQPAAPPAAPSSSPAGAPVPKGAALRIDGRGSVETLWSSSEDVPHSLALDGDALLVGTGDEGNIYRVEGDGRWALVASVSARQVTDIAAGGSGPPVLVTSNPARVVSLTETVAPQGTFVSEVKDAGTVAAWGRLRWEGVAPPDTQVGLATRSGNSSSPDSTWGPWTEAATNGGPTAIRSESARFLQIRLTLSDGAGRTPAVEAVSAAYLQHNRRPRVTSITIHPPGQVFQKPIAVSGEPEILGLEPDPVEERRRNRPAGPAPSPTAFSRKLEKRGLRTFDWTADDPNGDLLVYDVEYRAVGDDRWRPLRRQTAEAVLAWDTSAAPDGRYVLRVTASDAPDNPPDHSLSGHKDSTSFAVDNAPPVLTTSLVGRPPKTIRAVARDAGTPISRLEVSIDAGRWHEVYPTDGINDSREETYELPVPDDGDGASRVVVLRVSDQLGNVTTARVDVP